MLKSFDKAAGKLQPTIYYVKVSDSLVSACLYPILDQSIPERSQCNKLKMFVICVGHHPNSDVRVFNH